MLCCRCANDTGSDNDIVCPKCDKELMDSIRQAMTELERRRVEGQSAFIKIAGRLKDYNG